MKIAHIVPPAVEKLTAFRGGELKMAYVNWELAKEGPPLERSKDSYLILDHGTFERITEIPLMFEIVAIQAVLDADEVVLPDVLGDAEETAFLSGMYVYGATWYQELYYNLMFVPQGRDMDTWKQWLENFLDEYYLRTERPLTIGLSSLRREEGLRPQKGSRIPMIEFVDELGLEMHLLGLSSVRHFYEEELPAALQYGVRSIDTCEAFALAYRGLSLTPKSPRLFLGDTPEIGMFTKECLDLALENMQVLNLWIGGEDEVRKDSSTAA